MSSEQWRPVIGWESLYEVSDQGHVRSLDRWARAAFGLRQLRGRRLAAWGNEAGYQRVQLSDGDRRLQPFVHALVLEAFVGPRPQGMEARHLNNNPSDNALTNLSWATHMENILDKHGNGTWSWALNRGHCPAGHAYDEANTYIYSAGYPACRTCRREGMRAAYARKKAAS